MFGRVKIFRWHHDFKKLSAELTPRPGWPESTVVQHIANPVLPVLQEDRQMMCENKAVSTNISKNAAILHST